MGNLRTGASTVLTRARAFLSDQTDHSIARRMAGSAFLIRVAGAGATFLLHVTLARWMGAFEFGVYVYVWTWLVLIGLLAPLGIAYSAQRFIPEYSAAGDRDRLRGFIDGSRFLSFGLGAVAAVIGTLVVLAAGERIPGYIRPPLLLAFASIPFIALACAQDGIARSYNWVRAALVPNYVAQPVLVLSAIGIAVYAGIGGNAVAAMAIMVVAIVTSVAAQTAVVQRRLRAQIEPGPRRGEPAYWFRTALPIFMVDGFYLLLTYTDVLVLQLFVDPARIGVYFAATKTLVVVSFVHYAVSTAFAHRFSEAHFARERGKLEAYVMDAVRWTFWPSLLFAVVLLALGKWILMLFGAGFTEGYPLLFVLVLGLLARASVGPGERLLIMVGQQRVCAVVYGVAFVTNLVLCFTLVPYLGAMGAAVSVATALILESALLYAIARQRLGIHLFFWRP